MDSSYYKYLVYIACVIGDISKQTLQEMKQKKIRKK